MSRIEGWPGVTTELEEDERICGDTVRLVSSSARGLNRIFFTKRRYLRHSPLPPELLERVREACFRVDKLNFNRSQVFSILFEETLELVPHVEVVLALLKKKGLFLRRFGFPTFIALSLSFSIRFATLSYLEYISVAFRCCR